MKKLIAQTLVFGLLIVLMSCKATAQKKYANHVVKEGETLHMIAEQYGVTQYSILLENKNVRSVRDVKPNMVLRIDVTNSKRPVPSTTVATPERPSAPKNLPVAQPQANKVIDSVLPTATTENTIEKYKPVTFRSHQAKRKENIYRISKDYNITEEQLKKYNPQLYSAGLKKGDILKIPVYPSREEVRELGLDFDTYIIEPKDTRWSVASKYGISIDSLLQLNPQLDRNSTWLGVGQELKVPTPRGSVLNATTELYQSYTVPPQMTIYSISKNFDIEQDRLLALNPQIIENGGLKTGMVLRIPKPGADKKIINTENYNFYVVKPKETFYSLIPFLKVDRDELFRLNPDLENGLKAGMVLKLPKEETKTLEVKNALVLDKFNLMDSINVANRPSIMYLLPFRLDRIDFQDVEKTESQVGARRDIKSAVGMYTGALVALDSIKKMGVSVDAKFFDTELSKEKVKLLLEREPIAGLNAIVGPLSPGLLSEVAIQASNYNVPVIAPIAANSELSLKNVFYSIPDDESIRNKMLAYIKRKKKGTENVIIIADEEHAISRDSLLSIFPNAKVPELRKNVSINQPEVKKMFVKNEQNWVFIETKNPSVIAGIASFLNATNSEEDTFVKLFTTSYNNAYEKETVSRLYLSNLGFTYSSVNREKKSDSFFETYEKRYGVAPDRFAIRGFDITFDLLLKLAYKNNLFTTNAFIGETEYSANRFNYFNKQEQGYFNRSAYLMEYDDLNIKQIQEKKKFEVSR